MTEWQLLGLITTAIVFRGLTAVTAEGAYIPLFNRYFLTTALLVVTGLDGWLWSQQLSEGGESYRYPAMLLGLLVALNLYLAYRVLVLRGRGFGIEKKQEVYEWLDPIIVSGLVAFVLISYVMRTYFIPSESMLPTLQKRDYILVNKFIFRFKPPRRNNVIVFIPPIPGESRHFIKRVIGLPGEEIKVEGGRVFVDGKPLDEPFIKEPPKGSYGPRKVEPGSLFVMGDNRNDSDDSRSWGLLPMKRVEGKAIFIFWPLTRARILQ